MRDHSGIRYGNVTGVRPTDERTKWGEVVWEWRCELCGGLFLCGTNTFVRYKRGSCPSCAYKPVISPELKKCSEYNIWASARQRCNNPNNWAYPFYGGKGVKMCKEWVNDFKAFYDYMGPRPQDGQDWSLDRIDVNGNYEPGNVRWATRTQQAQNRGPTKRSIKGISGVYLEKGSQPRFRAQWIENGIQGSKSFGIKKYGYDEAFRLACEYRAYKIAELNEKGACYPEPVFETTLDNTFLLS